MAEKIIQLTDEHYIGEGLVQKCYNHPENDKLCVKVAYVMRKHALGKINKELKYYEVLKSKNIPYDIIPKYHGAVETNLGKGQVFDLIRDYDGNISANLTNCLSDESFLAAHYDDMINAMKLLKEKMLAQKIITLSIHTGNILCRKDSQREMSLVIIDNLGSKAFFPLEYYVGFIASVRIERRWRDFLRTIRKEHKYPLAAKFVEQLEKE